MAWNDIKAQCAKGVTLRCRHIVGVLIGIYAVVFVMSYGIIAGKVEREYSACLRIEGHHYYDCADGPARVLGPFIGAAIWPVYWPLHISRLVFA